MVTYELRWEDGLFVFPMEVGDDGRDLDLPGVAISSGLLPAQAGIAFSCCRMAAAVSTRSTHRSCSPEGSESVCHHNRQFDPTNSDDWIGKGWDKVIYPSMEEALVGSL